MNASLQKRLEQIGDQDMHSTCGRSHSPQRVFAARVPIFSSRFPKSLTGRQLLLLKISRQHFCQQFTLMRNRKRFAVKLSDH
jgi:hypothetical protein